MDFINTGYQKIKTYSKINIFLEILNKREDGYHNILSFIVRTNLGDEIDLLKNNYNKFTIQCDDENVPEGEDNTIRKSFDLFQNINPIEGITAKIKKTVPLCAGLGGGSGDAGALIKLLSEETGFVPDALEIAKKVGADVPFFLNGRAAIVRGIGEKVKKVKLKGDFYFLIVVPDIKVSTAEAYRLVDKFNFTREDFNEKEEYSFEDLQNMVFNRFLWTYKKVDNSISQFYEDFRKICQTKTAGMTGSGSGFFVFFDDPEERESIKERIKKELKYYKIFNAECV